MKLKKVLTLVSTVVLSVSMSFTAFAANVTGLTTCEQDLYDYLSAGVTAGDFSYNFSTTDLNKAISYMQANELTEDQVSTIKAQIEDAKTLIEENGIKDLTDIDATLAAQLVDIANVAGDIVGVTFVVDEDGNIGVEGADGATYTTIKLNKDTAGDDDSQATGTNDGVNVNKTGFGLEATAAVVALLSVTLASCAVYAKKRTVEA